jgi:hypothetical protein
MRATLSCILLSMLAMGCSGSADQAANTPAATGPAPNGQAASIEAPTGEEGAAPPPYGRITPPGFVLDEGEGVTLSGTIRFVGAAEPVGTLMMEINVDPGADNPAAGPIHVQELEGLGDWAVQVPEDLGPIMIIAYFDADMNGPNPEEPKGHYDPPLSVGSEDIPGIDFMVTDEVPPDDPTELPPPTVVDDGTVPPEGRKAEPEPLMLIHEKEAPAEAAPAEEPPAEEPPVEAAPAEEPPAEAAPAE